MLDLQAPPRTEAVRTTADRRPQATRPLPVTRHIAARGHLTATDGVLLHVRSWLPADAPPAATLVFIHGIASHGGWFAETAAHLADRGIAVYAPDRRGSGLSGGTRGHIPSYEQAMTDLRTCMDHVQEQHRQIPMCLAGSSWAAKLAVATAAEEQSRLAGLLLLGPGLFPRVDLAPGRKVSVLLAHHLRPEHPVAVPLVPGDYTRQAGHLAYIQDDPYRLTTATARFFWETHRLDQARDQYAATLRLPVLLQIGGADRIMDSVATVRWFDRLPAVDRTALVYRGAAHTLDFEARATVQAYRADLLEWLRRHIAGTVARRTNEESDDGHRDA